MQSQLTEQLPYQSSVLTEVFDPFRGEITFPADYPLTLAIPAFASKNATLPATVSLNVLSDTRVGKIVEPITIYPRPLLDEQGKPLKDLEGKPLQATSDTLQVTRIIHFALVVNYPLVAQLPATTTYNLTYPISITLLATAAASLVKNLIVETALPLTVTSPAHAVINTGAILQNLIISPTLTAHTVNVLEAVYILPRLLVDETGHLIFDTHGNPLQAAPDTLQANTLYNLPQTSHPFSLTPTTTSHIVKNTPFPSNLETTVSATIEVT